jgi:Mor family transcriptional regulator
MMGVPLPQKARYLLIVADAKTMPIAHVARKYGYSRQQIYNILRGAK